MTRRLENIQDTTAVTIRRLTEAAGQVLTRLPGTARDDEEIGLIAALIETAAGISPGDDALTAEIVEAIQASRKAAPRGEAAPPGGPGRETLRDAITFWLSGPGVPPLGWTVRWITDQTGAPEKDVRAELGAMAAEHLVRFTAQGRKVTWFLLDPGGPHLIVPLPGSVLDRTGSPLPGYGSGRITPSEEYPLRALCSTCHQPIRCGADTGWEHVPPATAAEQAAQPLSWHEGRHGWVEHDGYPRHQHSVNGALTISPHSTQLHFAGGLPFEGGI